MIQYFLVLLFVLPIALVINLPLAFSEANGTAEPSYEEYPLAPIFPDGENSTGYNTMEIPIKVQERGNQTNLKLETNKPVSPYIKTLKPEAIPDDLQPYLSHDEIGQRQQYQLETGIGIDLNKNAGFNLGYRVKDTNPLLDSPKDNLKNQPGEVHFGLDIKIPFD